ASITMAKPSFLTNVSPRIPWQKGSRLVVVCYRNEGDDAGCPSIGNTIHREPVMRLAPGPRLGSYEIAPCAKTRPRADLRRQCPVEAVGGSFCLGSQPCVT